MSRRSTGMVKSLPVIKSALNDFCNECGAWFPPREGEGICKEWQNCLRVQKSSGEESKDSSASVNYTTAAQKTAD